MEALWNLLVGSYILTATVIVGVLAFMVAGVMTYRLKVDRDEWEDMWRGCIESYDLIAEYATSDILKNHKGIEYIYTDGKSNRYIHKLNLCFKHKRSDQRLFYYPESGKYTVYFRTENNKDVFTELIKDLDAYFGVPKK